MTDTAIDSVPELVPARMLNEYTYCPRLTGYERRLDAEVRHTTFGYKVSYRRVLEVQARVLAAHALGEIPEYVPFMTR